MSDLYRLKQSGKHLVTDAFALGEETTIAPGDYEPYVETVETEGTVDLGAIHDVVNDVVGQDDTDPAFGLYKHEMETVVGPAIHRHLDINRRLASDPGVWHYLASIEFPHYVRHRFEPNPEKLAAAREKFLGAGTNIYSNAIHRLWWITELTYEPEAADPYERTRRVLGNQTLANKVFDRWFARYEPAAKLCVDVLSEEMEAVRNDDDAVVSPTELVEESTLRFRQQLTSDRLEGMSDNEIRNRLGDICTKVRAGLA